MDKLTFLFLSGEPKNEAIILHGDVCFLALDLLLTWEAIGGYSMILVSPELKVSSSVLCESPSISSSIVFGEGSSFFTSETICFRTGEAALSISLLPIEHFELD